jgi:hypothetical protein
MLHIRHSLVVVYLATLLCLLASTLDLAAQTASAVSRVDDYLYYATGIAQQRDALTEWFAAVTRQMDRTAVRARVLDDLRRGNPANVDQRYRELVAWMDETSLLVAYADTSHGPVVQFWNIGILRPKDDVLLADIIVIQQDQAAANGSWPDDLAPALERAHAEYARLTGSFTPAQIATAMSNVRQFVMPLSIGHTVPYNATGSRSGKTPYSVLLSGLDTGTGAALEAREARMRATARSGVGGTVAAAVRDLVHGEAGCGNLDPARSPASLERLWTAYVDTGDVGAIDTLQAELATFVVARKREWIAREADEERARRDGSGLESIIAERRCLNHLTSSGDNLRTVLASAVFLPPDAAEARMKLDQFLEGLDRSVFELRTWMFGLGEDQKLDRIRELEYRMYVNADSKARDAAIGELQDLQQRTMAKINAAESARLISNDDPAARFITDGIRVMLTNLRTTYDDGVVAAFSNGRRVPRDDSQVERELATYRGPSRQDFNACSLLRVGVRDRATAGQSVVDGLPDGPIAVTLAPGVPATYALVPAGRGRQRLVVTSAGGCVRGQWSVAGPDAALASGSAGEEAFDAAMPLLRAAGEGEALARLHMAWFAFASDGEIAARDQAVALRQSLLERLVSRGNARPTSIAQQAVRAVVERLKFIRSEYRGPRSGQIVWTGDARRAPTVTITGRQATVGTITGALPGVECRVTVIEPVNGYAQITERPVEVADIWTSAYASKPAAVTSFQRMAFTVNATTRRVIIRWDVVE